MRWFFLSIEDFIKLLLATVIIYNFFPLVLSGLWTLAFALILFFSRKNKVFYKDNFSMNPDMMLAPVNGKVLNVLSEDGKKTLIQVRVPFYGPIGLFMPFEGVVEKLDFTRKGETSFEKRRGKFTNRRNGYRLTLRNKTEISVGLNIKGLLGMVPRVYVRAGDKGKSLACFGYAPLGAKLEIAVSNDAKVLVAPGDRLKAGETAVLGLS